MTIEQLTALIDRLRECKGSYVHFNMVAVLLTEKELFHIIDLLADERLHKTVHGESEVKPND